MLESENRGEEILAGLDQLAEVCDAGTRVVVIGRINDVAALSRAGAARRQRLSDRAGRRAAESSVRSAACSRRPTPSRSAASSPWSAPRAASARRPSPTTSPSAIARDLTLDAVVTDLDLAFGTAGLDFNQDPPQGIAEAVFSPDRVDNAFVDRLLSKCTDHLSLLAAPATLDRVYDFGADAFESIFNSLRATVPCVVLDVPHQWTGWTKQTLVGADDILIVAAPDLANLRNTKNIYDFLKAARPNDHRPRYCLNQVGMSEAARDQGRRLRQGARRRSRWRSFRSSRRCSARRPITGR